MIPVAYGAGVDLQAGPRLLFEVMAGIFRSFPGGRVLGSFFFLAVIFAVVSSLFTFLEIIIKTFDDWDWAERKVSLSFPLLHLPVISLYLLVLVNCQTSNFHGQVSPVFPCMGSSTGSIV